MPEKLRLAAERGDVSTLLEYLANVPYFGSPYDPNGRSIVAKLFLIETGHAIIPEEFFRCIHYTFQDNPNIFYETDIDGDTPFHILAKLNPDNIMIHFANGDPQLESQTPKKTLYPGPKPDDPKFFNSFYQRYTYSWKSLGSTTFLSDLIDYCNRSRYFSSGEREWLTQNKKGNTVLHEAIIAKNDPVFIKFAELNKGATTLVNNSNETLLHLLAKRFLTQEGVRGQLEIQDKDENTALHVAIKRSRFDVAKLFLSLPSDGTRNFNTRLLGIANKEGDTPGHMIGSLPYLPPEFEDFIWKDSTMIGTRSIWGIPTMQMEGYVNTMGVIAALLTTITFTAAFAVPGGLNQEKGTPILIKDLAFQVFIISDVLAMCLSMIVLFCLLWIMAVGDKSKSVLLLDFSIILLLASFYTTLLTFMTGLYATIHLVKPWIAIFSLVPCSMLLLLMHKALVIKLIIPFGELILIFVDKVYNSAKDAFHSILKKCWPQSSSPMPMSQSQDAHGV